MPAFIYRPEYRKYDFGEDHPLRPVRISTSLDLLSVLGLLTADDQYREYPPPGIDDLALVHTSAYIDAVRRLDLFADDPLLAGEATQWGLGPGDSPAFVGMHAASAAIAGGTPHAVPDVLDGAIQHAFNPAGGSLGPAATGLV